MLKVILLLTTLALLPACDALHQHPNLLFYDTARSARGHFLYSSAPDGRLTLMAMTASHQVELVDSNDALRPLPCYRARSLDPSLFAVTLPDGTIVPDAAICRPFGLSDSFFGHAEHAGDTAVEIRDGATILDQIPLAIRDASDIRLSVPDMPPSDTGLSLVMRADPYELKLTAVAPGRPELTPGTAPWTLRLADPSVVVLDDGAAELTRVAEPWYGFIHVSLQPRAVGSTTLTVTLGGFTRDYPISVRAPTP
jgi:hypothetical protein